MTGADRVPCPDCGRPLPARARFCGGCGRTITADAEDRSETLEREANQDRRRIHAVLGVYGGVFLVIVLLERAAHAGLLPPEAAAWLLPAGFLATGIVALHVRPETGWRAAAPIRVGARGLAEGIAAAPVSFGISVAYVAALRRILGPSDLVPPDETPVLLALLAGAVVPALVEEWLCRGVLWRTLEGAVSPRLLLVLTSLLFAFLHGLNGGFLLELPHRFASALVFGWLRARHRSLLPSVAAHFAHNSLAVLLG